MKKYLPFLILASCFLLLKVTNLGIRLSDTNIYFYTGYQLLQGKILYKDIFFTNFPLLPYVSSLYYLLTFKQLPLFYFTAAIEAAVTGFLIYKIVLKQSKDSLLSALCSSLYLFSFMLLSTTEHQTGVFLASLFAVASYYFYLEKRYLFMGIFIALALLTKAYFLPIFATYLVILFFDQRGEKNRGGKSEKKHSTVISSVSERSPGISHFIRNDILRFVVGFTITIFIILLPSLLLAPHDFIKDVFQYSLTRSQGVSKMNILWFFITHDLLLFASLVYSIIMIRKHLFFGLLSIFSIIFFFLYKDIYYLYLNFLLPFLCLAFANLYQDITKRIELQKMIIPSIIIIFLIINFFIYMNGYRNLQKIENIEVLTQAIEQANPQSLYGINSLTPVLAYLTDTPLLNGIVDTNPNIYRKGYLNATKMTAVALKDRSLFVTQGLSYPEFGVEQPVTDEIFDTKIMKNCRLVQSLTVKNEGPQNRINLISCL
jgi:hypothetical protein